LTFVVFDPKGLVYVPPSFFCLLVHGGTVFAVCRKNVLKLQGIICELLHKFESLEGSRMLQEAITETGSADDCLGLPRHLVRMHAYSAHWPELFVIEQKRIMQCLAPLAPATQHIGSTAVPGLAAKPIIDILMGVQSKPERTAVCRGLQLLGYEAHGEKGVPGRLFFSCGTPSRFHLHLVQLTGPIWKGHILFRDSLIADPALAAQYETLKRDLARRFPADRDSYTRGKAFFIEKTLAEVGRR
jgi:GrpB-like predicted nucleotidyltransferase (UPF0157 family)